MSRGTGLDVVERTKRAQTLGRIVQKTLTVVIVVMAALMILRELDIDITPVLTGAGIAGLAVGFGAQTLVRDVISGFFLILEDQVRVGDVAVVNGQGGLVEEVNLRTIVLRDEEGAVHMFPNGEVKTLANMSKDFCLLRDHGRRRATTTTRIACVAGDAGAGASLMSRPGVQAAHPRAAGGLRRRCVRAGPARREGAHQDRAAEAVGGRTRAAEADRPAVQASAASTLPHTPGDVRRVDWQSSESAPPGPRLQELRPEAGGTPPRDPRLHAVAVAGFAAAVSAGVRRWRVERIDGSSRHVACDAADVRRRRTTSLSVSDLAIVGDRHQRAIDIHSSSPSNLRPEIGAALLHRVTA